MQIFKKLSLRQQLVLISLLLVVATLAAYWQVHEFDFVNFDDNMYVFQNENVQHGLTVASFIWAFTTFHEANWHPITWLSHMLDYQLFGMDSGKHHLVNLFFHVANSLLLFFILRKMTGRLWRSAMVAALFALHPLHAESVAWVSERKDVLSTFFWLLTMWAYFAYVKRPSLLRYMFIVLFFVIGLMSKPMLVTLPFVLLLLDYWPLNRISIPSLPERYDAKIFATLVLEKFPLIILAVMSSGMTYYAQQKGGAITSLNVIPLAERIMNSLVAYFGYIVKMVYPVRLACFYPYSWQLLWWEILASGLLIVTLSAAALWKAKKHPYVIVGWLWYLGALVPVIGIVQVGSQAMADRYTYVPLIGIFIIIAWGIPQLVSGLRLKQKGLPVFSVAILFILCGLTWHQVGYWRNTQALFEHTLNVTSENYIAHKILGDVLSIQGCIDEATQHYFQAMRIKSNYVELQNNLATLLFNQGQYDAAFFYYQQALRIEPNNADTHFNIGKVLFRTGHFDDAIAHFFQAIKLKPEISAAHIELGNVFYGQRKVNEAIAHYQKALEIQPDSAEAHANLANALCQKGQTDQAIEHYLKAIQFKSDLPETYNNLGVALISKGDINQAIQNFQKALKLKPDYLNAKNNLDKAVIMQQQSN